MADAWVTVKTFDSLAEAVLARSVLQANEIRAFIPDENWWNIRGGGVPASIGDFSSTGVVLQVMSKDKDEAVSILDSAPPAVISEPNQSDFVQPVCPQCGSTDVSLTSASGMKNSDGTRVNPNAEAWRCEKCRCIWSDDDSD